MKEHADWIVFFVCMFIVAPMLAYQTGYHYGYSAKQEECPKQDGKKAVHSIKQDGALKCVYVEHVRGFALTQVTR